MWIKSVYSVYVNARFCLTQARTSQTNEIVGREGPVAVSQAGVTREPSGRLPIAPLSPAPALPCKGMYVTISQTLTHSQM